MKKPYLAAATLTLLLTGCVVVSIRPFYFAQDVVDVPELMGTWYDEDGATRTFAKTEEGTTMTVADNEEGDEEEIVVDAVFFRLGDRLYLDYRPPLEGDAFVAVRIHFLSRVVVGESEMRLRSISSDMVEDALESGALDLDYLDESDQGMTVLMGSTTELQGFIAWCEAHDGCFGDDEILTREPPPPEPTETQPDSEAPANAEPE